MIDDVVDLKAEAMNRVFGYMLLFQFAESPEVPPGLANARPQGRAKLAKAPPPGLTMLANALRLPGGGGGGGGGWAQVELTDA